MYKREQLHFTSVPSMNMDGVPPTSLAELRSPWQVAFANVHRATQPSWERHTHKDAYCTVSLGVWGGGGGWLGEAQPGKPGKQTVTNGWEQSPDIRTAQQGS